MGKTAGKKLPQCLGMTLGCVFLLALGFMAVRPEPLSARTFKIAAYNLENLFDMHSDGSEYPDYRPGGPHGWSEAVMKAKLNNMAMVISDLDADIIGLQEVESKAVLLLLQKALARRSAPYPHMAIANAATPVKCAVLSRFPIVSQSEIHTGREGDRSILKVGIDIDGRPLLLYVNHWKAKSGPESRRMAYAQALAAELKGLPKNTDYLVLGDFNSDYDEFARFSEDDRLNDTRGITGINHGLNTIRFGRLVDEALLTGPEGDGLLYNLWLEIPAHQRWSVDFFGRKNSPDAILVPPSLYDGEGISYVDNSFEKFDPPYLFEADGGVFRWQRAENGRGRHLGTGYSDHLPVFAEFETGAFRARPAETPLLSPTPCRIVDLYAMAEGPVHLRLSDVVVIYKKGVSAVIKEKNGRAVYVYKVAEKLEFKTVYDLTVTALHRHYGNLEITGIADIRSKGAAADLTGFFLTEANRDVSNPVFQNEVLREIRGVYENGWLRYGDNRRIRLYFPEKMRKPANFSALTLRRVRIGYHGHPEVIVEDSDQIR